MAAALNATFDWPDGRVIDRRQVEQWDKRRTLNQMSQPPPSPLLKRRNVPRTAPKRIHDPAAWIEWARAGVPAGPPVPVPGKRGLSPAGWTVPVEKAS